MTMKPFQILDELNQTDEHKRIEAKDSRSGQIGKSVFHTLSAFSNEPGLDGGYLLFGVERQDGAYRPVGVVDPDKLQTSLSSMCSQFNAPIRPRVEVEMRDGKCLVSAFIPEADVTAKPVYRKSAGLSDGAFRRNGSTDVHCAERDLEALFIDRRGRSFESHTIDATTLADFDPDAIATYRNAIARRDSNGEVAVWPDEKLLRARHCLEEVDGNLHATVTGLALFGTRASLENEMWMSSRVDYIRIYGVDRSQASEPMKAQTFWGPLVQTIPDIVDAVVSDLPRRMGFPPNAIRRTEEAFIPRFVLREAIVNAVMHRDYRQNTAVQIIRYTDRLEIRNPGRSLKPIAELGEVGSTPRNPNIAHIFYQLQFAEAMGSGLHRIKAELAKRDLPEPVFESTSRPERFISIFRFEASTSSQDQSRNTSAESHKTLTESHKTSDQDHNDSILSAELERLLCDIPTDIREQVEEARVKHRISDLRRLLLDICSVKAFSTTELAELLDRERSRLVRSHLKPLVEEGVLELTHPENPRHPKQAYRTVAPKS